MKWIWPAGLLLISACYLLLKSFSLNAYAGDEFIYLYQGKLIGDGVVPYTEFAMAHPPLQALFTALVFKVFGVHFMLMRSLPMLWCLGGGIGLAVLARRELGTVASLAATALYLLAHEPLRASSHYTGINMTVSLMIFTVLLYRLGWIRTAAALAVAAVFTRLYAIPGVAALTLFALVTDRKNGVRLVLFGALIGAGGFVLLGWVCGFEAVRHNIFAYHADKTPMTEKSLAGMRDAVLFHNATLAALFALSLAALVIAFFRAAAETDRKLHFAKRAAIAVRYAGLGLPILSSFIALLFLVILLNMNRVWMYYYIPAFPFAALCAGWLISQLLNGAVRLFRDRGSLSASGLSVYRTLSGTAAVILFLLSYVLAPMLERRLAYFNDASDESSTDHTTRYTFPPSPLPAWLQGAVRTLLWREERVVGAPYNTFNFYLWHESRTFNIVDQIIDIIKKDTSESGEIFGDSGTVPLFALLSSREIAGHEVDTNIQRYRSGNADPKELISKIDNYKTEMIILRRRFGVYGVPEVLKLAQTKYRKLTEIRSAQGWVFQLYKRKHDLSELKEN